MSRATRDPRHALALRVREQVLRLAGRGGCFVGAALSCVDLLVHLYTSDLRLSPSTLSDPERDVVLLSKGHAAAALYATLAETGFFPRQRLDEHLRAGSDIYWHPNPAVPGVECHSGSLGHLLAVGVGLALDARLRRASTRVLVLLGDGELDEGSVWEAALVAASLRLDQLVAIVDRNGFQANGRTEEVAPLEPLAAKWEAFGWGVRDCDGHDFAALDAAFAGLPVRAGGPSVVLARTRRQRGLPSLEGRAEGWFAEWDAAQLEARLAELRAAAEVRA